MTKAAPLVKLKLGDIFVADLLDMLITDGAEDERLEDAYGRLIPVLPEFIVKLGLHRRNPHEDGGGDCVCHIADVLLSEAELVALLEYWDVAEPLHKYMQTALDTVRAYNAVEGLTGGCNPTS